MEDQAIIQLYWERSEQALDETEQKYGEYCRAIAHNILHSREDAEECVNQAYLQAWNSIPPNRPNLFSAYLGKITRNLALNRYRQGRAKKRGGNTVELALEELDGCIPAEDTVEKQLDAAAFGEIISRFLKNLPELECNVFLRRYWYLDPVREIAQRYRMSASRVKSMLFRTRARLKEYLQKEGIAL